MTWNNYLQSLDRWIAGFRTSPFATAPLISTSTPLYTHWRKGTSAVCRDGRAIFMIGNGAGVPAMTTIANHHSIVWRCTTNCTPS